MILPLTAGLIVLMIGIFTASETAFLCIDKTKVSYARAQKKVWAIITSRFIERPAEFFSTILVCEDLLIVIASNLLALFFINGYGKQWVTLATIILSAFSLIFGQLIPKSIALIYPEKTLSVSVRIIQLFRIILLPVVALFAGISSGIAGLFKSHSDSAIIRHQDIVSAIGEYERDTSFLAARLFDFSKRKVGDIMVPIAMTVKFRIDDNFRQFCVGSKKIFRYIPVYEGESNNIVGVISTRDYLFNDRVTMKEPFFVSESEKCMHTFMKLKKNDEYIAIVRNNNKEVTGIITIYDLIEELVGAIREEK